MAYQNKSKNEKLEEIINNNQKVQRILEYKRQGYTNVEIERMPDVELSKQQISNYIRRCLELGLITQEEIDEGKKLKEIEKLKKKKKVQKILEYKKQGYKDTQIGKMPDIGFSHTQISIYIGKCLELDLITKEEIDEGKKLKEIEKLKKNEKVQKILEYKKQGYTQNEIGKMPDIGLSQTQISNYIRKCLELGLITQEEIDEGLKKRTGDTERKKVLELKRIEELKKNEKVQKILEYKKQGYTHDEIGKMPDIRLSGAQISIYIRECLELGLIKQEEIDEGKKSKEIEKLKKNEKVQKILEYKKQGYKDAEIGKMPDIGLSQTQISIYIKKCLELGLITQEEIDEGKKLKEIEKLKKNKKVQKILEYKKQGYKDTQIGKMPDIGLSHTQISNYIRKCLELSLITLEEINKGKTKKKRERVKNKANDESTNNIKIDLSSLFSNLVLGYSKGQIMKKMNITNEIYQQGVKILIKQKRLTQQEIDEYRRKRKEDNENKILKYLKDGKSDTEIIEALDDVSLELITHVKKENNITDEDILEWRNTSPSKIKQVVLIGLKRCNDL